jgi:hypothetical protein
MILGQSSCANWTECDLYCGGEFIRTAQNCSARLFANRYLFCLCLVSSPDPGLRRVSVLKEIKCKNYHGCYQQEVNQAGGDKATIKSN